MAEAKRVEKTSRKNRDSKPGTALVPGRIIPRVRHIRGEKVLLDYDLAELYGVPTGELNRSVKRNAKRFPADFMFQLTPPEWTNLKCQNSISSSMVSESAISGHGGRRTPPYAFTEQGVAMLSSVLNSDRAIEVNIAIMRTFVQLRELMATNKLLEEKIERLEKKYEGQFEIVFDAIKRLMREHLPDGR